jgi:hypothetical protein
MVLEAVLPMPGDALSSILPMFLAERVKFVVLDALDYYQGKASIRYYRLSATWDPEDLPPESA